MKKTITSLFMLVPLYLVAQALPEVPLRDKADMFEIMQTQQDSWNAGDIEAFMNGYWESDSLMFVGKSGITYGYHNTFRRYQQGYPDRRAMGTLTFEIDHLASLGKKSALMIGRWRLVREDGDLGGFFSLTWRKIRGEWVIVVDHTS